MKLQVGGLYSYPIAMELTIPLGNTIEHGEPFVVLEELCFTPNSPNRAHIKVLTTQGIVGWIPYIDKTELVKITHIGKFCTYRYERGFYKDEDRQIWCGDLEANQPFVILEISNKQNKQEDIAFTANVYKVLTAKGEIGWIAGVPKHFQEVSE